MDINEAKRLTLLKWEYIVNNGSEFGFLEKHPEFIKKIEHPEWMYDNIEEKEIEPFCDEFCKGYDDCPGCPIRQNGCTCFSKFHPQYRWVHSYNEHTRTNNIEYAEEMIELINKI